MCDICKPCCKCLYGMCTCQWCTPARLVRLHCKANGNYNIAVRATVGFGTCIVSADDSDPSQLWLKDNTMAWNFDHWGGFSLIHRDTRKVIKAAPEVGKQVLLVDYNPRVLDEGQIWFESPDKGNDYHAIHSVNKEIVLHALRCAKCDQMQPCPDGEAFIKENTLVVTMGDRTKPEDPASIAVNQLWRLMPVGCCPGLACCQNPRRKNKRF